MPLVSRNWKNLRNVVRSSVSVVESQTLPWYQRRNPLFTMPLVISSKRMISVSLCANISETNFAGIITEQGGEENH
jgi:hypothetical protein